MELNKIIVTTQKRGHQKDYTLHKEKVFFFKYAFTFQEQAKEALFYKMMKEKRLELVNYLCLKYEKIISIDVLKDQGQGALY